ncbi:MAG: broad specificity phosphatase PhoE [Bacteroidia bacterium]
MTTNKTIYLIRHGQTDYNLKGIVQGSGIDSDLNERGRSQALDFHKAYRHIPFDFIYTSELKRTHQSVAPFIEQGLPWKSLPELNEINWGVFEGLETTPESRQAFQDIIASWRSGDLNKPIDGGESPVEMYARQEQGWDKILSDNHQNILVCMHGRAMRSFLSLLLNTPLRDMDQYPHTNLCLYTLEKNGETNCRLLIKNDVRHLKAFKPS